jgi:translation initiation factor 3 subunit I
LFFSTAKDKIPSVWFARNGIPCPPSLPCATLSVMMAAGERLGTFEGHNGSVWGCTVDHTTKYFVTGSADNSVKVWDIETGGSCESLIVKPKRMYMAATK